MVKIEVLKSKIKDSGMTMTAISAQSGILRETLYNRLNGIGDFTASEITAMTRVLHLSRTERDEIFLSDKLN